MARLYSDENFPAEVVGHLRGFGHDVLTIQESGLANRRTADVAVLEFATSQNRTVLTMNRRHFIRLHLQRPQHDGIVVCSVDADASALADRIDRAIAQAGSLLNQLLRVNRPA